MRGFLKKLLIFLGIAIVIGLLAGSYFLLGTYSDGYRIGTIIKITKKGYIFKTYEGQLNLDFFPGTLPGGQGVTQNIWDFSVSDRAVADSIEKAVDHGARVKLYYDEKYYRIPWRGETKYIVNKVEQIRK